MAGLEQLVHAVGTVHRHDPAPCLPVRRVEGHRKGQLQLHVRQTADAREHAAGGQADVPHPNVQSQGVIHQLQKPQHVVQVIHGLPDAHQHDVGYAQAAVQLGKQHLLQHLPRRQVPDLPPKGGGTEGAPHPAPHLAGDAHGVAVTVLHEHRLDTVAIVELPEVLDGAVGLRHLLPGHGQAVCPVRLRQLLPEGLRYVAHLIEGAHAPVEPGEDLLPAEGRFAQGLQGRRQLLQGHGSYVCFHDRLILQM